jgi:hypothetical protein
MPVDPVTVSWEAARRGSQADPGDLAGGCGAFCAASAAQVYRRAVLARAEHAGLAIQADATDDALPMTRLLDRAGHCLMTAERDLAAERCRIPQPEAEVLRLPAAARRGPQPEASADREAAR